MILIALGANRSGPWGSPRDTVTRAIHELDCFPLRLVNASRLLITKPFGVLNQPDFVNAVAQIETHLPPPALLVRLQMLERDAGRQRARRWGPRTLDLDIIDYNGLRICTGNGLRTSLTLPHPGIAKRTFVLEPLAEIAPWWQHPVTRLTARQMQRDLERFG